MKRSFIITLALIAAIAVPLCASSGWARGLGVLGMMGGGAAAGGYTVSLVANSYAVEPGSTTGTSIAVPTGTLDGDLIVVTHLNDTSSIAQDTPIGWTKALATDNTGDGNFKANTYYKVANGEGGTVNFTSTTASRQLAATTFRKTGGTWNVEANSVAGSTGPLTTPAISTATGGVLYISALNDGSNGLSAIPDGMTLIASHVESSPSTSIVNVYQSTTAGTASKTVSWAGSEQVGALQLSISAQ